MYFPRIQVEILGRLTRLARLREDQAKRRTISIIKTFPITVNQPVSGVAISLAATDKINPLILYTAQIILLVAMIYIK